MKLFIPPLGTKVRLLEDFQFQLLCESRNEKLWNLHFSEDIAYIPWQHARNLWRPVQLIRGDTLVVDRIYIRKNFNSYDSVTFRGEVLVGGIFHKVRFWMKLEDANRLDVEVIE